jgi:hypothetical protein
VTRDQASMSWLALAALLLLACGAEPEAGEALPNSGVTPDKRLNSLGQAEIESLCNWSKAHVAAVECDDGSVASHAAVEADRCVERWPFADCSARVADLEGCLASDPCDVEDVTEACAAVLACSFGSEDLFACADGQGQVLESQVCDGAPDCADISDEADCGEL